MSNISEKPQRLELTVPGNILDSAVAADAKLELAREHDYMNTPLIIIYNNKRITIPQDPELTGSKIFRLIWSTS